MDHRKSKSSRKISNSALLTTPKILTVGHNKLWKILTEMRIPDTLPAFWEICKQVKKQQLEPDMEEWIGSKSGKEYVKVVYCHPDYLTYKQSTSWEMLGWKKHKLELRVPGEISRYADDTTLTSESEEKLKGS